MPWKGMDRHGWSCGQARNQQQSTQRKRAHVQIHTHIQDRGSKAINDTKTYRRQRWRKESRKKGRVSHDYEGSTDDDLGSQPGSMLTLGAGWGNHTSPAYLPSTSTTFTRGARGLDRPSPDPSILSPLRKNQTNTLGYPVLL